ncbi:RHS repeat domain-containing protein, partial [Pseudomonas sp. HMWF021]|uniref:RHS repeat domain-containing protein n=1 Tax=Pseudomonas sp. HMWF021 TaxID=2056857 RepID=UPI002115B01F
TRVRHSRDELPESFAHDPAGNLLMQDRPGPTRIKGNRLLMQGDRHYDYDAFGNLIRERRGRDPQLVTEYRYDCQHRLIGLTRPDGKTATYQYDAFGRRIRKTVDGLSTEFFWQGDHLVAESSKAQYRSYVYEPGTFRPLALLDGKGPKRACPFYYQLDHLGTPQELTDYSGEIVWSAQYDAYGKVAAITLAGEDYLDQPLRFQGQYFDAESGLHNNRHRYYDPRLGRYLTPDPIKLAGGLNQYQYVPNPTGWVDPLGLSANCPPPNRPDCSSPGRIDGSIIDEAIPTLPKPNSGPKDFGSDEKLIGHFEKHGAEFNAMNKEEYLLVARDVVNQGTRVEYSYKGEVRSGYLLLMGNNRKGETKFAFVGTNTNDEITTLHTKSGKEFWRTINGNARDKTVRPTHD